MRNLPFLEEILADLRRFAECVEDNNDVNLERSRFDLLVQLGLLERVQRSPARWMMTQAGEDAIAQPTADEPVAHKLVAVQVNGEWKEIRGKWVDGAPIAELIEGVEEGWCRIELAFAAPPAASVVQYRLLRVGEIIQASDELMMDDCTTWQSMSDGPQLGIGREWHAGLVPMRRAEVAGRAQGDGEPS